MEEGGVKIDEPMSGGKMEESEAIIYETDAKVFEMDASMDATMDGTEVTVDVGVDVDVDVDVGVGEHAVAVAEEEDSGVAAELEAEDALAEQGETGAESGKKRGLPEVGGNVHSVSKKFKS
mmetsp:Transcript_47402/g.76385  ORF Transcript_47402/g.76385 Transcript_47402/m.76385 type:complete len:121 (+) Transcript_47402:58-420(+)